MTVIHDQSIAGIIKHTQIISLTGDDQVPVQVRGFGDANWVRLLRIEVSRYYTVGGQGGERRHPFEEEDHPELYRQKPQELAESVLLAVSDQFHQEAVHHYGGGARHPARLELTSLLPGSIPVVRAIIDAYPHDPPRSFTLIPNN